MENKELEALDLERIKNRTGFPLNTECYIVTQKELEVLEQAILELKSIKETNPSEALRKLDTMRHLEIGFDKNGKPITLNDTSGLKIIEKALTTKSKKEQAFDIIKKKEVDVYAFAHFVKCYNDKEALEKYNKGMFEPNLLTQEEFNLIKEMLKND